MIFGVSHIGLTVSELDSSISFYQEHFGFTVLSDAERMGDWIDKITGIPGFHSRTVYLSVTPFNHLELFKFYNPKAFSPEETLIPKVGIFCCSFVGDQLKKLPRLVEMKKEKKILKGVDHLKGGLHRERQVLTIEDPDGINLSIVGSGMDRIEDRGTPRKTALYPVLTVENIENSLGFYRDILGLKVTDQGNCINHGIFLRQGQAIEASRPLRWVSLTSLNNICLKLIQPMDTKILPIDQWRMERIGFTHFAFAVNDIEHYYEELAKKKVNFKSAPQISLAGPHKGGKAVYLSTPEGITLEFIDSLLTREQGKSST